MGTRQLPVRQQREIDLKPQELRRPVFSRQERQGYAHRLLMLPVALFVGLAATYAGVMLLILVAPLPIKVLLAVPCGVVIGMLFIVGHDAAHNSFTSSRLLNQVIGRIAFLPSLHAFSLWDLSHNRTHHLFNNVRGIDYAWEPLTPREYRALGTMRRTIYRFIRSPFGVPFYYLFALWLRRMFVPWPLLFKGVSVVVWLDAALVCSFLALQIFAVLSIGAVFDNDPVVCIVTSMLMPFLVWNGIMSFVIFLHHTHPSIEWYADAAEREMRMGGLRGTTRVIFPAPLRPLLLEIMEHNAHHLASGVPLYRLRRMQAALEARDELVTWRLSGRRFARVCHKCKLYDYDNKRWLTFNEAGV